MPGSRQVSSGSSDSTVPMPVSTASLMARMRCTRARAGSPVIGAGPPPREAGLAVGRDRELEHDLRAALAHAPDMSRMRPPRLIGADADRDRDAGRGQPAMALAGDLRIGILQRRHHPRDAGRDDGVGARRGLTVVRAGLERHVEGGAAGRAAGAPERLGLGMRTAAGLRPAASDDHRAIGLPPHHHGADGGVGPGAPEPAPAERQGQLHEAKVVVRIGPRHRRAGIHFRAAAGGFPSSSPDNSPSTASKSLASRKFR